MSQFQNQSVSTSYSLQDHMVKTFGWMFIGVTVSFVVAYFVNLNPNIVLSIGNMWYILFFVQLGLVFAITSSLRKMNAAMATTLFLLYSVVTGLVLSVIIFVFTYNQGIDGLLVVAQAFAMSAIYFGALSVIGFTTKKDLTSIGMISIAALFALIIYSFIAMLFRFPMNNFLYSIIGLLIFAGLTAWDVQNIKKMYAQYQGDEQALKTMAIYSAFSLYLNFINIFIYMLRILGGGSKK